MMQQLLNSYNLPTDLQKKKPIRKM